MTDTELDHLEALFRNPPSMGVLAEHGLQLVREVRVLKPLAALAASRIPPSDAAVHEQPIEKVIAEQHYGGVVELGRPVGEVETVKPKKGRK